MDDFAIQCFMYIGCALCITGGLVLAALIIACACDVFEWALDKYLTRKGLLQVFIRFLNDDFARRRKNGELPSKARDADEW